MGREPLLKQREALVVLRRSPVCGWIYFVLLGGLVYLRIVGGFLIRSDAICSKYLRTRNLSQDNFHFRNSRFILPPKLFNCLIAYCLPPISGFWICLKVLTMEAAGIIALVRATSSTCVQARTLCLVWKDAPRDVFHLRDELQAFKIFHESIRAGIVEPSFLDDFQGLGGAETAVTSSASGNRRLQREALRVILAKGRDVAETLGKILVELIGENAVEGAGTGSAGDVPGAGGGSRAGLAFQKKILWLRRLDTVRDLRKMLRDMMDNISLWLIMINL